MIAGYRSRRAVVGVQTPAISQLSFSLVFRLINNTRRLRNIRSLVGVDLARCSSDLSASDAKSICMRFASTVGSVINSLIGFSCVGIRAAGAHALISNCQI
ncbi:hypothetical protein IE4803_PB00386 (plasmid) [Rhizobium etli bv. phaseoli str. IE4803]|nr:hypothetical protein IE4803_PB00386 [Rhizobium etli bv. phaseoli str. IE4803]ARQ60824.1 hypothetical protein Kim5_PA00358 [Rhizobium sp. Kim5]